MRICVFNPGIETHAGEPGHNLGDHVIQQGVLPELRRLFPGAELFQLSTHEYLNPEQQRAAGSCDLKFVGASNLLSSQQRGPGRQWLFKLRYALRIRDVILFGPGWRDHQGEPNLYTRIFFKAVFSHRYLHSVRDNASKARLARSGIPNVINTCCPTLWPLLDVPASEWPSQKSDTAVIMLTDYKVDREMDGRLVDLVQKHYRRVFFLPQGKWDETAHEPAVKRPGIVWLERKASVIEKFVAEEPSFDYVGNRLHGGIRCLLKRRRTLILEVDNRAKEIGADVGLPTLPREDFAAIERWILGPTTLNLRLPREAIQTWRNQFASLTAACRESARAGA